MDSLHMDHALLQEIDSNCSSPMTAAKVEASPGLYGGGGVRGWLGLGPHSGIMV